MRARLLLGALALVLFFTSSSPADTYTVTNCNDSGAGSLREGITSSTSGRIIEFNIPATDLSYEAIPGGHAWIIKLMTSLVVSNPNIYINGSTQTINQGNTNPYGPEIVISSEVSEGSPGIALYSNGNTIEGMVFSYYKGGYTIDCGTDYNTIRGCYFGTDATGEVDTTTAIAGIWLHGNYNLVGGYATEARNLISGNNSCGIQCTGSIGNLIKGNYLGVNRTGSRAVASAVGAAVNLYGDGVNCFSNIIGGATEAERNLISGNNVGVQIMGTTALSNEVKGNYIGTDADGITAIANYYAGVYITNANLNLIGGSAEGERNVISGNGTSNYYGLWIMGTAQHNRVFGNYIGTTKNGTYALANYNGIRVEGPYNQIGGGNAGEGNLISGNTRYGLYLYGGTSNEVKGNYIGTNCLGDSPIPNNYHGVYVNNSSYNTIGGTTEGERNIISGNGSGSNYFGICASGTSQNNRLIGNYIGTDKTGTDYLSNYNGIKLEAPYNRIGGSGSGEGNVISGNAYYAIQVMNTSSAEIRGNRIGTNQAGTGRLQNMIGIYAYNSYGCMIGGTQEGAGNLISCNNINVYLNYSLIGNTVQGNLIGTDADGTSILPGYSGSYYTDYGVYLADSSYQLIGGATLEARNVIAGQNYGINVSSPSYPASGTAYNRILGNYVGVDKTSNSALPNMYGVYLGGMYNDIGGGATGEGNVISGNFNSGVELHGDYLSVKGNHIGTNASGYGMIPNNSYGVGNYGGVMIFPTTANFNTIGGTAEGERNIISGNGGYGVVLGYDSYSYTTALNSNTIQGNYIGLNKNGSGALPNSVGGILMSCYNAGGASNSGNQVLNNLISGNTGFGLVVGYNIDNTQINNNRFGVTAAGGALGNSNGIMVSQPFYTTYISGNEIANCTGDAIQHTTSGPISGANNTIVNNGGYGLLITGAGPVVMTDGTIEANASIYGDRETKYAIYNNNSGTMHYFNRTDWGEPTGPYDPEDNRASGRYFNPVGQGQKVSDYIVYDDFIGWGTVTPAAPTGLVGTAESANTVRWSWTGNTTWESVYQVVSAETGAVVAEAPHGVASTVEAGMTGSSTYNRFVRAWKIDASSESGVASATTPTQEGPTVTVTNPVAGGKYKTENIPATPIVFAMGGPNGVQANSASIYYSLNGGTDYILIDTSVPTNEPYYINTVPTFESANMRIKVTGLDGYGQLGTGESGAFLLDARPPTAEVIAPNGGERVGATYPIRWSASDTVGLAAAPITIQFSSDGGGSWSTVASGLTNTGTYEWTVPSLATTSGRIRVSAVDQVTREATAISAADFTIDVVRPTVTAIVPAGSATNVPTTAEVIVTFSKEMSREAAQNAFTLTAVATAAGAFSWSSDGQTMTFTPAAILARSGNYTVTIGPGAVDLIGNSLTAFSSTFTTVAGKLAASLKANNADLRNGDYVMKRPTFKANITDDVSLEASSLKMHLDGALVNPYIVANSDRDYTLIFQPAGELEDETVMAHSISVEANDIEGGSLNKLVTGLKVVAAGSSTALVGAVSVYPTTYSIARDVTTTVAYNLNQDADVNLVIFGPAGEPVWNRRYATGTNGGMAGYNAIAFNGLSDTSGLALGNGIYVFRIMAGGKVIGKGHIVIYD
ncbi:MAG: Ig-like domain-containing protein [Candidatus Margulisiibacteriota bacterium]